MAGIVRIVSESQLQGDDWLKPLLNQRTVGVWRYVLIIETNTNERITLYDEHLTNLLDLLSRLKPWKLQFSDVTFECDFPVVKRNFNYVSEIVTANCRRSSDFVEYMVIRCPRLKSLHDTSFNHLEAVTTGYWNRQALVDTLLLMIGAFKVNHHLTNFTSLSMEYDLKALLKTGLHSGMRTTFNEYNKTVKSTLRRNQAGIERCRSAVYQLFLIKRYRPASVFRFIGIDVVRLIAKLVMASWDADAKVWCR